MDLRWGVGLAVCEGVEGRGVVPGEREELAAALLPEDRQPHLRARAIEGGGGRD